MFVSIQQEKEKREKKKKRVLDSLIDLILFNLLLLHEIILLML